MLQKGFIHHVFFQTKDENDTNKLIEGIKKLNKIQSLKALYIGVPADTNREVIKKDYQVSALFIFADKEEHDKYQIYPLHLSFIAENKVFWSDVFIYDFED